MDLKKWSSPAMRFWKNVLERELPPMPTDWDHAKVKWAPLTNEMEAKKKEVAAGQERGRRGRIW